jgi:hypothetical protein
MSELTAAELAQLDPEQLEFLRRRLRRAGAAAPRARRAVARQPGSGPWPPSFPQQRLWFIHQLERRSAAYHIPILVDLAGPLDVPRLRAALAAVVRRHGALRTTFELIDGHLMQRLRPAGDLPLPVVDLGPAAARGLPAAALAAELARLTAAKPPGGSFDLERGPLLRAVIVRLDAERCRLLLVTPSHRRRQLVGDGADARGRGAVCGGSRSGGGGGGRLWRGGRPARAAHSVRRLRGLAAPAAGARRSWRRSSPTGGDQLAGAPPRLDLPTDRPRPQEPSYPLRPARFALPAGLTSRLKGLARQHGATLYMTSCSPPGTRSFTAGPAPPTSTSDRRRPTAD